MRQWPTYCLPRTPLPRVVLAYSTIMKKNCTSRTRTRPIFRLFHKRVIYANESGVAPAQVVFTPHPSPPPNPTPNPRPSSCPRWPVMMLLIPILCVLFVLSAYNAVKSTYRYKTQTLLHLPHDLHFCLHSGYDAIRELID